MKTLNKIVAIIPSAGKGIRFDSEIPKQYQMINNKMLIEYTLSAFIDSKKIDQIIVVVSPDDKFIYEINDTIKNKITIINCGGKTRSQSVQNAINFFEFNFNTWILVHDAVRCCITKSLITKLIDTFFDDEIGGIIAINATDSVKILNKDNRLNHMNRETIYLAQTPQMFRYQLLKKAFNNLINNDFTDEASAIESLKLPIKFILGDKFNIKITHKNDLLLANCILSYLLKNGEL